MKSMQPLFGAALLISMVFCAVDSAAQTCTGTGVKSITVNICTGSTSPENQTIRLYPNPAKDVLWLENIQEAVTLEFFDATGKKMRSQKINAATLQAISVSELAEGAYYLHWNSGANHGTIFLGVIK